MNHAPVPAIRLKSNMPTKLEDIINKALEKDRNFRLPARLRYAYGPARLKRDTD